MTPLLWLEEARRRYRHATGTIKTLTHGMTTWLRRLIREEAFLLLMSLVVVLALWVFAEIAEDVGIGSRGGALPFDDAVIHAFRQRGDPTQTIGPPGLVGVARDVTALGSPSVLLLMVLAVVGYLALERRWNELWLVAIAATGGGTMSTVLKEVFGRPRPPLMPPLDLATSPSFPSGHSMLAAVVYLTLGALLARIVPRRRLKVYFLAVAMLLSLLVGLSRVYLGVHYPTDVLGGWSAGLAWALLCWLVARHLQRRGTITTVGARSR